VQTDNTRVFFYQSGLYLVAYLYHKYWKEFAIFGMTFNWSANVDTSLRNSKSVNKPPNYPQLLNV